jgi:hypothetical protein
LDKTRKLKEHAGSLWTHAFFIRSDTCQLYTASSSLEIMDAYLLDYTMLEVSSV